MTAMRSLRYLILILVLAAAAALAWKLTRPKPLPVVLHTLSNGKVEATVANTRACTITACRRAKLAPTAGGQISRLTVVQGDRVKAGTILLELWNADLTAQWQLAKEQRATAEQRVRESCAMADLADRDLARSKQLIASGFLSPGSLDRTATDARARRANCAAAAADVKQATARINNAEAALERTRLRAPFDGIVAKVTGELGEYATPSPPGIPTPPAIDLIDDSCLYVTAPIDEVDAPRIKVGQTGRITVDAFRGQSFAGKVRRIAPYVVDIEKQSRTVDVEVEFTDPAAARKLLVGYSADVELVLDGRDGVLRVPTAALLEGGRVLVFQDDGRLQERTLKLGLANWEYTEVLAGLSAGERVVLSIERPGVKAGALVVAEPAKK